MNRKPAFIISSLVFTTALFAFTKIKEWQSKFVSVSKDGSLQYIPDEKGNIIPDFSRVGFYNGDKKIPDVEVKKTISPSVDAERQIQSAIDELSKLPTDKNGFKGAVLLKKGTYIVNGKISIETSGIVLRGEGNETK